ncbi:MAG: hypothetical protein A3H91_07165 [Gammaproteobacteria bacterium RIFCSPLOWO2_02_FULL_61_13]|nr:MAG: hypothetical protein A3H91_07165 [Gammaproteobacteria bacterium RIFCSPLOWO2_02_FULL_61_13]
MQDVSAVPRAHDSAGAAIRIAICIPTYRRNDLLRLCLAAVASLRPPDGSRLLVLIADNDASGGARAVWKESMQSSAMQTFYFVEPRRGLCCIRNRLVQEALRTGAAWIAFVDDDEQPAPDWLQAHMHSLSASGADVSCGPVILRASGAVIGAEPDSGSVPDATPRSPRFVACNNVLFRRKLIAEQGLRFDPLFNFTGGEDFDFFEASRRCGNRHIWTAAAQVYESLTPERSTLRYLFHRHWSGAMTRVLQQRKWQGAGMVWPRFLLKICGKLLGGTASLLFALLPPHRRAMEDCIKRYASAWGYLCGLLNLYRERYR